MADLPRLTHGALRWGGARNRADRTSQNLRDWQARKVIEAAERSLHLQAPFNRFITIAWELGGLDARESVTATGKFIKLAREWLRGHGERLDWAWVQESTPGNAHCHILLHVPRTLDDLFGPMPLRWVKTVLGGTYVAKVLDTRRLDLCRSPSALPAAQWAELMAKVHYMLKTTPAKLEGPLGMIGVGLKPWGRSCLVYGKRCAVRPRCRTTSS